MDKVNFEHEEVSAFNQGERIENVPLLLQLAQWIQKRGFRGGHRLEDFLRESGRLNIKARYHLNNTVAIDIPLAYRSADYKMNKLASYEADSISFVSKLIAGVQGDFSLADCGADIGLMSAKLVAYNPAIKQVVAFEPNSVSFDYLNNNMSLLGVDAKAYCVGVSDFSGNARLCQPDFDDQDHAFFIEKDDNGNIPIVKLDDIPLKNKSILLKIDVEGEELAVLRGATNTLKKMQNLVILFEAHHLQVVRTNIDPSTIMQYILEQFGDCHFGVVELPDLKIDMNRPFFEQVPTRVPDVYNICAYRFS